MKNIKLLIIVLIPLLGLNSCFDSFLEEKPYSFLAPENVYTSEDGLLAALSGVYYDLAAGNNSYARASWMIGEYPSEATWANNSGDAYRTQFETYQWTPGSGGIPLIWDRYYNMIYRANLILESIPNVSSTTTVKRIEGETHFLRAYAYFLLIRLFDHVPLITTSSQSDYNVSNEGTDDGVWSLIESDLEAAESVLPTTYSASDVGRATKGAAQAILAKVYLTEAGYPWNKSGYYQKAASKCEEVMDGRYSLEPNYSDVMLESHEHGPEYIFSIEFKAGISTPASNYINITGIRGETQTAKFSGWSSMVLKRNFYDRVMKLNPNDLRIPTIFVLSFKNRNGVLRTWGIDYDAAKATPHMNKFVDQNESGTGDMASSLNLPIIRYADVLLMHSEAMNNGGVSQKYNKVYGINLVRARAGLAPLSAELSQSDMNDAIIWERVLEFVGEGQAWYDYKRMGQMEKRAALKGYSNLEKKYYVFPIPEDRIQANPNLVQHPMWQ